MSPQREHKCSNLGGGGGYPAPYRALVAPTETRGTIASSAQPLLFLGLALAFFPGGERLIERRPLFDDLRSSAMKRARESWGEAGPPDPDDFVFPEPMPVDE